MATGDWNRRRQVPKAGVNGDHSKAIHGGCCSAGYTVPAAEVKGHIVMTLAVKANLAAEPSARTYACRWWSV